MTVHLAARYRAACDALGLLVWRPGMLSTCGCRCVVPLPPTTPHLKEPDFDDPATLGCLLAAVREVWGSLSSALPNPYEAPGERWRVFSGNDSGDEVACGPTEAEAFVAALEASAARRGGQP